MKTLHNEDVAEAVPDGQRALRRWVVWRYERRDGETVKALYQARKPQDRGAAGGVQCAWPASTTNAGTWRSHLEALYVARTGPFDGIAVVGDDAAVVFCESEEE